MPELWETGKWDLVLDINNKPVDSNVTAIHAHFKNFYTIQAVYYFWKL